MVERLFSTRAQQLFVITIVIQAIVVIAMIGIVFALVEINVQGVTTDVRYKTLACYLALFGLAELFELILTIDALKLRNVIQLFGILCFHIGLIVFSALQIKQTKDALLNNTDDCYIDLACNSLWSLLEKLLIVVPVILGVSFLVLAYATKQLYGEFGWAVFHAIGADPAKKRMYRDYQILIVLLKFDYFCFTGLTMQLIILILKKNTAEFGLTVAAIPIVLLLLVICGIAVKREIRWLMAMSLVLMVAAQTYFIYKLVRFYLPSSRANYITTRATLTAFSVVSAILLFGTFLTGLRCYADFDKGLREGKIQDVADGRNPKTVMSPNGKLGMAQREGTSYLGGVALQPRMSIE